MSVLPGYVVAIFQQAEKLRGEANWHSFAEAFLDFCTGVGADYIVAGSAPVEVPPLQTTVPRDLAGNTSGQRPMRQLTPRAHHSGVSECRATSRRAWAQLMRPPACRACLVSASTGLAGACVVAAVAFRRPPHLK
ncbi:hypothetical protein FB107DRAFT_280357 [Schizophyllum commune]